MSTIEENVVKMRFDNTEFDKNIEKSTESVDDFKKSLDSLPDAVSDTASVFERLIANTSIVDILNFAQIHSAIDDVKSDFLTIPNVVKTVAEECESLFQKITGINVMGQIAEGGQKRAQNIEQAMFMLKGLNLDTKTFMDAANYAVKGTAYGLDSAVKVAAQLGASGMTVEEDLKQALRGISGVAAMTNSTYDEIGRIFTFAASYGKVTSRQLLMLSTRGINATAAMAKQMGKTEQEVRSMMSKGQVTFKDFAKAMDDAFGEHSKKANETFSGSMANVRAALSRIGADAFTPWRESMIKVYNQLQVMFDTIKSGIKDSGFYDSWTNFLNKITPVFTDLIQWIGEAYQKSRLLPEAMVAINAGFDLFSNILTNILHINWGGWVTKGFNSIANALRIVNILLVNFVAMFQEILGDRFKTIFDNFVVGFAHLSEVFAFTEQDLQALNDIFGSWFEILDQIFVAITEIFGTFDRYKLRDKIKELSKSAFDFIKKLKASDTTIDKFKRTFVGVASALDIIRMLVMKIFEFVKPAGAYLAPIADKILTISARIGDTLKNLRDTIKTEDSFGLFFEKVVNAITKIKTLIGGIGTNFFEAFFGDSEEGTTFIDRVFDFITKTGAVIGDAFENSKLSSIDLTAIKDFFNQIFNFGFSDDEVSTADEKISRSETLLDKISKIITKIKELFFGKKYMTDLVPGEQLKDATDELSEGLEEFEDSEIVSDPGILDFIYEKVMGVLDWVKGLIEDIAANSSVTDVGIAIAAGFGALALVIDSIAGVITAIAKMIEAIGIIIMSDAVSKFIIARKDRKKETTPISTITDGVLAVVKEVKGIITQFEDEGVLGLVTGGKHKATSFTKGIWSMIWFLVAIVAAIVVLSTIPVDDLNRAVGVIAAVSGIMLGVIVGFAIISNVFNLFNNAVAIKAVTSTGNITQLFRDPMKNLAIILGIIAFGLVEIAAAIAIIADTGVKPSTMWGYVGIILVCLVAVAAIAAGIGVYTAVFKGVNPIDIMATAFAIDLLALAIGIIALSLVHVVKNTKDIQPGRLWQAFGIFNLTLLIMAVVLGALSALTVSGDVIATAFAMILFATAMGLALEALTNALLSIHKHNIGMEEIGGIVDEIKSLLVIVGLFSVIMAIIGAIPLVSFTEVGALLAGLGVLFIGIAALLTPAIMATDALMRFLQLIFEVLDVDSSNYEDKLVKLIKAFGKGLGQGLKEFNQELFKDIDVDTVKLFNYLRHTLLPSFLNFLKDISPLMIQNTLSNVELIFNTLTKYAPDAIDAITNFIYGVLFGFRNSESDGILETIFDWIDEFNDNMVVRIVANIPKWVAAAYAIIMGFIIAIRKTLEENQETIETELTALMNVVTEISSNVLGSEKNQLTLKGAIKRLLVNIIVGAIEMVGWIISAMDTLAIYIVTSLAMAIITRGKNMGLGKDWLYKALFGDEDNLDLEVDIVPVVNWDDADMSGYDYLSAVGSSGFTSGYNTSGVTKTNSGAMSYDEIRSQYELLAGDIGKEVSAAIKDTNSNINISVGIEPDSEGLFKIVNTSYSEMQSAGMMDYFGQMSMN